LKWLTACLEKVLGPKGREVLDWRVSLREVLLAMVEVLEFLRVLRLQVLVAEAEWVLGESSVRALLASAKVTDVVLSALILVSLSMIVIVR